MKYTTCCLFEAIPETNDGQASKLYRVGGLVHKYDSYLYLVSFALASGTYQTTRTTKGLGCMRIHIL